MDQETKARAFEPFSTTKSLGKGTSLGGLATVHGISHQNPGFVDLDSQLGAGPTMGVYMPREAEQPAAEDTPIQATTPGTASATVLLVEDGPVLLKLTATILEQLGFAVLANGSPSEAIRLAEEYAGDIDLLVADVVMPEMNGAELQRRIQAVRPRLSCLFISGYPADVLAETGVLGEGVDFLQKPFDRETLALKVHEVLARR